MSTTFATLIDKETDIVYRGRPLIKFTATGGTSSTALNTSSPVNQSAAATIFDNCGLFSLTGTNAGQYRPVSNNTYVGSTGTITVAPAFTGAVVNTDTFLMMYGLTDQAFLLATNRVVTGHYWPRYMAVSLATDGDMEAANTTSWTVIAGASRVKTSTAAQVYTGTQALDLTVTASGDGIQSASVPVVGGYEMGYLSVLLLLSDSSKSCTVELYDVTNSVTLGPAVTVAGSDWTEVRLPASTILTTFTTENVAARIKSTASGTWHIYIDYVQFLSSGKRDFPLPSQIAHKDDLRAVMYPSWSFPIGQYLFKPGPLNEINANFETWRDFKGVVPDRVEVIWPQDRLYAPAPLFWFFYATESALTSVTSTTLADTDAIVYGSCAEILEARANTLPSPYREKVLGDSARYRSAYAGVLRSLNMTQRQRGVTFRPLERSVA